MTATESLYRAHVRVSDDKAEEELVFNAFKITDGVVTFIHADGHTTVYVLANIIGWWTEDVDS
jgi:hypothetical protein